MTSRSPEGCFVYITLPGQTEQVVAARFEIRMSRGASVGRLVYGRSYLERRDAVPIDPVDLSVLDDKVYERAGDTPLFSSLRDALPDYWGRLVIERAVGGELDDIGLLLRTPDDRAGALGFGLNATPPAPNYVFNRTLRLEDLMRAAQKVLSDTEADQELVRRYEQLNLVGTAMGGARPKAVVEDEDGLWLAKFPRKDDKFDVPRAEHAMLLLAQEVGISTAESKLVVIGHQPVLMVKRFDREKVGSGYLRHRMVSALTVLRASDSATDRSRWSYPLLADALTRVDVDHARSKRDLFSRMVFNALISNADDHPRNHALIADARGWRLSPAYDLLPHSQVAQDRMLGMQIGDEGRAATASNLLSASPRFGVQKSEAEVLIDRMRTLVSHRWYPLCRSVGMTEADCGMIESAFDFEGFGTVEHPSNRFGS